MAPSSILRPLVPSFYTLRKLTWIPKIAIFERRYILKTIIGGSISGVHSLKTSEKGCPQFVLWLSMGSGSFKMIPEKKKKNTQIAGNPNSFSMPWDPYLEVWDWYGSSNLESLGMVFRTVQTSYAHKLAKTFYFL